MTAVAADRYVSDLRDLGADEVVASIELAEGPFSLITESVGGESLAHAIERIAPGGTIVMFGTSSGELTPVGFRQFVPGHEGARLQSFAYYTSGPDVGADIGFTARVARWRSARSSCCPDCFVAGRCSSPECTSAAQHQRQGCSHGDRMSTKTL
ncbi:hypothetical protein [Mesorhizobium sp. M00.F.Ca.ET.216.01.1.1]|uniref:hypothetical protein n=1 Tax=Mesorhizobium sp. M00.F.Ca.ET.216.01.1.1 TaxID=2500528 RepID=UPI001FDF4127|nr:hypothetical protein [Mesorhizobium sp. M00.F.Ca.ET.216.01.1.1]